MLSVSPAGEPSETPTRQAEPPSGAFQGEVTVGYSYRPLIAEGDRPIDPVRIPGVSHPPAPATVAAPRRSAAPHRVPQPEQERDEIEIHIGRIEVTAVPQTSVRPAVQPPARKSLNLDEYLKRRNRGA